MYRKESKGLLKHWDFALLDMICLQLALWLAYYLRVHRISPDYVDLYKNMAVFLALADLIVLYSFKTLKNVLRRGHYKEFVATLQHSFIVGGAAICYLFAMQKGEKYSRLALGMMLIQFMVLGLVLTGFVFLGKPFIRAWAGEKYGDAYLVALLLITPVTVPLIQNLGVEIQRAKNMHKARAVVYLAISVANVFISIPLIRIMESVGAALGTAISLIAGNIIFMNWYYHSRIGMNMFYFWKEIAKFIPALIAPCIVGVLIMKFANIIGLVELGVFAVIYAVVYAFSMYFLGMNDQEKQLVVGPIKKVIS